MKTQILKIAGLNSEKEFYKKYPTEESFFRAFPQAKQLLKAQYGLESKSSLYTTDRGNQYEQVTKDPTQNTLSYTSETPARHFNYFSDENNSEINIKGSGNQTFFKPDPLLENYLKTKVQSGTLERFQKGKQLSIIPPEAMGRFSGDIPLAPTDEFYNIRDYRKVRATTNKPIRPNVDAVSGKYPREYIEHELKLARDYGLPMEDIWNLAAMAFQETGWGKSDKGEGHYNIGHVLGRAGDGKAPTRFINAYLNKMKEADRLNITDPTTRLQVYNGLGLITPNTEKNYHGFKMKKVYGVPVPPKGISMRRNPLYGKQIIDIRDNVLKKNPEIVNYINSLEQRFPYKQFGGLNQKELGNFYNELFSNISKRKRENSDKVSFLNRALGSLETIIENPKDALKFLSTKKEKIEDFENNPYNVEPFQSGVNVTRTWYPKYRIPSNEEPTRDDTTYTPRYRIPAETYRERTFLNRMNPVSFREPTLETRQEFNIQNIPSIPIQTIPMRSLEMEPTFESRQGIIPEYEETPEKEFTRQFLNLQGLRNRINSRNSPRRINTRTPNVRRLKSIRCPDPSKNCYK